jgi:hypothetical protein
MTARSSRFAREWSGTAEPHVVIVRGRAALEARYNTSDADVIEIPYSGGSWNNFLHRVGDTLSVGKCGEQVFIEIVCERARKTPIIVYIPNAVSLVKECGDELVRFIAFWEEYALYSADGPERILLALQFPERPE